MGEKYTPAGPLGLGGGGGAHPPPPEHLAPPPEIKGELRSFAPSRPPTIWKSFPVFTVFSFRSAVLNQVTLFQGYSFWAISRPPVWLSSFFILLFATQKHEDGETATFFVGCRHNEKKRFKKWRVFLLMFSSQAAHQVTSPAATGGSPRARVSTQVSPH